MVGTDTCIEVFAMRPTSVCVIPIGQQVLCGIVSGCLQVPAWSSSECIQFGIHVTADIRV